MRTPPNLKREKPLKVPLNDLERDELRKFCAGIKKQVAPWVRDLAFAHIRAELNRKAEQRKREWPRHGHVQRFPGRAAGGSGFRRLHL